MKPIIILGKQFTNSKFGAIINGHKNMSVCPFYLKLIQAGGFFF